MTLIGVYVREPRTRPLLRRAMHPCFRNNANRIGRRLNKSVMAMRPTSFMRDLSGNRQCFSPDSCQTVGFISIFSGLKPEIEAAFLPILASGTLPES